MPSVEIEVKGLDQAVMAFSHWNLGDRRDLLTVIGAKAVAQTQKRFVAAKADPDGAKWKGWSARYAKSKSAKGRGLLIKTGRLMGSIQPHVGGDFVEVGTNVFYGKFHQYGTSKMAKRAFLGFGAKDLAEIKIIVERFIGSRFGAAA